MKSNESQREFENLLRTRDLADARLTGASALDAMITFYKHWRADDCDIARDGDMLLYQSGIYGFGRPKSFQFDVTRQFIVGSGEDDEIFQLKFTLHFPVSAEVQSIKAGNHWCHMPEHIPGFEAFVRASEAFKYAAEHFSESVEIHYECAG